MRTVDSDPQVCSAAHLACPDWCTECRRELGLDMHPDDRSVTHARVWDIEAWPLGGVAVEEFVYEADASVGQRDIALWVRSEGAGAARYDFCENLSAEQARGLARVLLKAADLLDAAGGQVPTR